VPSDASGSAAPGSQDCTATRWPVADNGLFRPLPGTGNSSSSNASDAALKEALNWLSCSAHYCCGLQVMPNSNGPAAVAESSKDTVEPIMAAFDGPDHDDDKSASGNASIAQQVGCR
jgi:hypothetical protein